MPEVIGTAEVKPSVPDTKDRIDKERILLCGEKTYQGYNSKGAPNPALPFGVSKHANNKKKSKTQQKGSAKYDMSHEVAKPSIEEKTFETGTLVWFTYRVSHGGQVS